MLRPTLLELLARVLADAPSGEALEPCRRTSARSLSLLGVDGVVDITEGDRTQMTPPSRGLLGPGGVTVATAVLPDVGPLEDSKEGGLPLRSARRLLRHFSGEGGRPRILMDRAVSLITGASGDRDRRGDLSLIQGAEGSCTNQESSVRIAGACLTENTSLTWRSLLSFWEDLVKPAFMVLEVALSVMKVFLAWGVSELPSCWESVDPRPRLDITGGVNEAWETT